MTIHIEEMPLDKRREYERARYEQLHRTNRLYGATNHGAAARGLLLSLGAESVLDVGCGDNAFAKWLRAEGVLATGCDFADQRADVVCPAHDLPFPDAHFDWVTSFDVLEHLWEDEVLSVLKEFHRVGRVGLLVSISYVPAKTAVPGGNLHRCVHSPSWWDRRLQTVLRGVQLRDNYLFGKFKP